MQVDVQIERAAEALQDHHRAATAAGDAPLAQATPQEPEHRPHEQPRHRPAAVVVPRQPIPQVVREGQHPLADRHVRQDMVHEMRGVFHHASAAAPRRRSGRPGQSRRAQLGQKPRPLHENATRRSVRHLF
jgi:hypothetical protein